MKEWRAMAAHQLLEGPRVALTKQVEQGFIGLFGQPSGAHTTPWLGISPSRMNLMTDDIPFGSLVGVPAEPIAAFGRAV